MKAYTSFKQSKKLAKILPRQSADMNYVRVSFEGKQSDWFVQLGSPIKSDDVVPCWSLAALLKILKDYQLFSNRLIVYIDNESYKIDSDNPVDACVDMIIELYEQKLL